MEKNNVKMNIDEISIYIDSFKDMIIEDMINSLKDLANQYNDSTIGYKPSLKEIEDLYSLIIEKHTRSMDGHSILNKENSMRWVIYKNPDLLYNDITNIVGEYFGGMRLQILNGKLSISFLIQQIAFSKIKEDILKDALLKIKEVF